MGGRRKARRGWILAEGWAMEPLESTGGGRQSSEGASQSRHWLRAAATVALVVALLAAFGGVALWRSGPGVTLATITWQTYHDPLGLFTVRLPPGWTATVMLGWFGEGDRTASMNGRDETITFSDPTLGQASANFSVWAYPITNLALAQSMECTSRSEETGTFNGYPATPYGPPTIMFESDNAHFQIDETIPGALQPSGFSVHLTPPFPPTPTPLPAAAVASDRALLGEALASFRPADPHPLACG
jgi:hypothetical protein